MDDPLALQHPDEVCRFGEYYLLEAGWAQARCLFGKAVIMIFSNLGLQVDTAATEDYSKVYFRPGEDSVWPEVACACVTGLPFLKISDIPPVRSYHVGIVHRFVHELLDDGTYCWFSEAEPYRGIGF